MPRKRKIRTPSEEEEYQHSKKEKRRIYMQNWRKQKKNQNDPVTYSTDGKNEISNRLHEQGFQSQSYVNFCDTNNYMIPFFETFDSTTRFSNEENGQIGMLEDHQSPQNRLNIFNTSSVANTVNLTPLGEQAQNLQFYVPITDNQVCSQIFDRTINFDTAETNQARISNDNQSLNLNFNAFSAINNVTNSANEQALHSQPSIYYIIDANNSVPSTSPLEINSNVNSIEYTAFDEIQLPEIQVIAESEFNDESIPGPSHQQIDSSHRLIEVIDTDSSFSDAPTTTLLNSHSNLNTTRRTQIEFSNYNDDILLPINPSVLHIPFQSNVVNRTPFEQEEYNRRNREQNNAAHQQRRQRLRQSPATYQELSTDEHYLGKMDVKCRHCNAYHFKQEKVANKGNSFNDCCSHGEALNVKKLPDVPDELKSLYLSIDTSETKNFFENIRSYNNSLAFASFNANLYNFPMNRNGPYCFKIQGQIYCQINTSLYPEIGEAPSYGQLFITDPSEAVEARMTRNSHLDSNLLTRLDNMIRTHNVFAHSYIMMKDELLLQQNSNENAAELQLLFTLKPGYDRRRYNIQNSNEVAAIFSTSADGEIPESYVTIRNKNTRELKTLSSMDPNVEPWIYPLMYPYGTRGWSSDIKRISNVRKRVSRSAYTKFLMAIRDEFNPILHGRKLFQQWVVDLYVKVEKDRLEFVKNNQTKLRADSYKGLQDYLHNMSNETNQAVGKIIILPSTFAGSPRNMMQNYQDAMAIVRKYGIPSLFITMTCNPKWREITENLKPGQQPSDRPDICARVFNLKVKHLLYLIQKSNIYGQLQAFVYTIEFQKRGLPHVHLLVTLKEGSKITTAEQIDEFISAEIPDKDQNPRLYDIVMKNMIHGPCGAWCEIDGKCSKHFPKSFVPNTIINENGSVIYRRRDTGILHERNRNFMVNNQWVVPYSPKLSLIFNCHINVEIVNCRQAIKYLYKYIYKGHDAANVVIGDKIDHDEVKNFLDARYVGPCEAVWRIMGKNLHDKSHAIVRLPVHLPGRHTVVLPEQPDHNHLEAALQQTTMLLDYFALNARDEAARQYTYIEIPEHYVFKKVTVNNREVHRWVSRQRFEQIIARLYSVNPRDIELYHLRLLLHSVRGATSFEHLRTVSPRTEPHETFVETCIALELVETEDEWKHCLEEAMHWMMPGALRSLYVRILIHCLPLDPQLLWDEFKNSLSEDFLRKYECNIAYAKAFAIICGKLEKEGCHISDFPTMNQLALNYQQILQNVIEQPNVLSENLLNSNEDVGENGNTQQDYAALGRENYSKLNPGQKKFVDEVINAIDDHNRQSKCFYLDGPGGSGKTFVYETLYYLFKGKNMNVSTMAFTGIAAILLPQGKTVHKTVGLPVPLYSDSSSKYTVESKEGQLLKNSDAFLWDEAPMAPRYALEILDRTLRDFTKVNQPFGGKIIILGGDFRQLLPVKIGGNRCETVNLSIKFSHLWKEFEQNIFKLTENMRTLPEEVEFTKFLLDLGNGKLNDENHNVKLPVQCVAEKSLDIVKNTFEDMIKQKNYGLMSKSAILSARNVDVNELNRRVIDLLDEKTERTYYSVNSLEQNNDGINEYILPEHLNTLDPSSLPPHELRLRQHSIIMLIRNLSIHEGLCNGTRLLILEMTKHLLKCKILNGDKAGNIVFINRITLISENDYPFTFRRRQLPVKPAFAVSINKSQGQTLEGVAIDLRSDVFSHGHLYVALSRVRSWSSVKVFLPPHNNDFLVKNLVYQEMLI